MGDSDKKKRLAILVASSFILVVIGVAVTVGVTKHQKNEGDGEAHATTKAVQAMCQATDYKQECAESLKGAGNSEDPKELIKAGFNFTRKKLDDIMGHSATLKEAEKDPFVKQAFSICKDMMDRSLDDLEQSFEKVGELDASKIEDVLDDLETWLSAAITFQGTCLDEFENATGPGVDKIKAAVNSTMKFSSNSLVMVQQLNQIFKDLNIPGVNGRRRLLQQEAVLGHGELPLWLDPVRRRLLAAAAPPKADFVIAQDGSGNFKTFAEAINALPKKNEKKPVVVHVKAGVYKEYVTIPKDVWNVTWVGDGAEKTKISGSKGYTDGIKTSYTATVTILGTGHTFKSIGFENTAGAIKHQAVAVLIDGDKVAFFNCRFDGFQDTLYPRGHRQYFRDCTITGTIDFIFGDSRALFQNCLMLVRRPLDKQQCIVTAQGKQEVHSLGATVIQNCTITGDQSYMPVKDQFKSYLGRPWKEFSTTIYMQSFIDSIIDPEGWMPWAGTFGLDTSFYAEFNNRGPGSNTARRVKWKGIKTLTPAQAKTYTGKTLLAPDEWIPSAGIPYIPTMV